jgi:outer membrane biosynthesis protein TonB
MKRTIAGLLVFTLLAGCGKQAAVIKRIPTPETKKEEVKQAEVKKAEPAKKEEVKTEPVKKEEVKQAKVEPTPAATPEPTGTPAPAVDVEKKTTGNVWSRMPTGAKIGVVASLGAAAILSGVLIYLHYNPTTPQTKQQLKNHLNTDTNDNDG